MAKQKGSGGPYIDMGWEDLPEDIRENNRRQARSIAPKLNAIGCNYDAGDTPYAACACSTACSNKITR